MSEYETASHNLEPQPTAVMRGEMPARELAGWLPECYRAVHEYLRGIGIEPSGPPFVRYTFLRDSVAVEAGFPVEQEVAGDVRVEPSALPGGQAAVTTHFGRYEDLEAAYKAVLSWLEAHGYAAIGPHWEVNYTNPQTEPDPRAWRTDVVVPYRGSRRSDRT